MAAHVLLHARNMDPQLTASRLIEEYGSEAIIKVVIRVFETRILADVRAEAVWLAVLGAVIDRQMLQPAVDIVLH
jgi:hypothetical protein